MLRAFLPSLSLDIALFFLPLIFQMIRLAEDEITNCSPAEISNKGMASVPQDRLKQGLIGNFSVKENLILGAHSNPTYCSRGILNWKNIMEFSKVAINNFDIRKMFIAIREQMTITESKFKDGLNKKNNNKFKF